MPRPYTEAEAQAYAARVGVRIETARSALSVQTGPRTKEDITAEAKAYATKHGVSLIESVRAVASDEEYFDAPR